MALLKQNVLHDIYSSAETMPKILITSNSIFSVKLFIQGLFSIVHCMGLTTKGYLHNIVHEDHDTGGARYIHCNRGSEIFLNSTLYCKLTVRFHRKVMISYILIVDVHVIILLVIIFKLSTRSRHNSSEHTSLWN